MLHENNTGKIYITITKGMSGFFAVMVQKVNKYLLEPINTGIGRYNTEEEAIQEGIEWAKAEGVEFKP